MRLELLFVALLMVSASVYAVDFHVFVEPAKQAVCSNESVVFNVEIRSNFPKTQIFEVYSPDVDWDVSVESFVVPANGTVMKQVSVRPLQNVRPGLHSLPIVFRAVGAGSLRKVVMLDVVDASQSGASYLPSLRGSLHIDSEIDPRLPAKVSLVIENQNRKVLDEVKIRLRSEVINGDFAASFGPLEQKTLTYDIQLDPMTNPQKDVLTAMLLVDDGRTYEFDLLPTPYKILSYGDVSENVEESSGFLTKQVVISLKNEGNADITHVFSVPAGLARLFISSSLPGTFVGGDLRWDVRLAAGEELKIEVKYNYQPLFWMILVLLLGSVMYFYFRSPVVVKKRARIVGTEEDGISEMKVVIELHNRSLSHVRNVKVMDMVPHVAKFVEAPKHGLAPSKIVPHDQKGTLVKWDIGLLEGKEQRILTYTAKCKFTVLGSMTLPVAVVQFTVGTRDRRAMSNRFTLSIT